MSPKQTEYVEVVTGRHKGKRGYVLKREQHRLKVKIYNGINAISIYLNEDCLRKLGA